MTSLEDRVAALEAVVRRLTDARAEREAPGEGAPAEDRPSPGDFWILEELRRRAPEGAITFAGQLEVADGPVQWQWGAPAREALDGEWDAAADPLAALGHPVRLRLLQLVLAGHRTTAELAAEATPGTTGQLHHHLRALTAAGWLHSTGRGRYAVPPQRVVPLLVIVSAATC